MNQVCTQALLKNIFALDNERWEIYCGSSCSEECQRNFEILFFNNRFVYILKEEDDD